MTFIYLFIYLEYIFLFLYIFNFQEVGWGGMDWINLAQDRDRCRVLVNAVTTLRVP
jgi:hypothetical protein